MDTTLFFKNYQIFLIKPVIVHMQQCRLSLLNDLLLYFVFLMSLSPVNISFEQNLFESYLFRSMNLWKLGLWPPKPPRKPSTQFRPINRYHNFGEIPNARAFIISDYLSYNPSFSRGFSYQYLGLTMLDRVYVNLIYIVLDGHRNLLI